VKPSETQAAAGDTKVTNPAGRTGEIAKPPVSNPIDSPALPSPAAHKSLPKASEHDRREAKLQMDLAAKLAKKGDPEGALKALQEAARLNPSDVMTHKCLAVAYVSTHLDFDRAISEYELARKLPGVESEIADRLTSAIANKGVVQKQLQLVKESRGDADAYYELAKILSKPDMLMLGGSPKAACDKAQEAAEADAAQRKILVDRCYKMETEWAYSKYNYDCPVQ
jgi:tetratricopeptide (TPR) repeat protein